VAEWLQRSARTYLAKKLANDGTRRWKDDRFRINQAIAEVEQAWRLSGDPEAAIQLCTMYDLANRNDDALVVLREAFRAHPHHARVRHHAAITLLRHGVPGDVADFFDGVLAIDPNDAFARFAKSLLDRYDGWVAGLVQSIEERRQGRQPFVITVPVWGQPFTDDFVRYGCAALMAENNLPALAREHSAHLVICTSRETAAKLDADPLLARLRRHATIDFVLYDEQHVGYGELMQACYGHEPVPWSEHSLAFYYARNCKFALMSCAHYVALAAGRVTDAMVSCQVADSLLSDGSLPRIAALLARGVDAVMLNGLQLPAEVMRPLLESRFRRDDGSLQLSSDDCDKLVVEHLPAYNFARPDGRAQIPLRVCWRVGDSGILAHGNHYHPIGLRPAAFAHPLRLTIDPVDSRFVDRSSLEAERLHMVGDSSIVALSLEEGPLAEQLAAGDAALSADDLAFWLWGYWGRLRATFFRTPLRLGAPGEHWQPVEAAARAVIDDIVERAEALEDDNRKRRSWRP
jgi:hypothetical protein